LKRRHHEENASMLEPGQRESAHDGAGVDALAVQLEEIFDGADDSPQFYAALHQFLSARRDEGDVHAHRVLRTFSVVSSTRTVLQVLHDVRSLLSALSMNMDLAAQDLPIILGEARVSFRDRARALTDFRESFQRSREVSRAAVQLARLARVGGRGQVGGSDVDQVARTAARLLRVDGAPGVTLRTCSGFAAIPAVDLLRIVVNLVDNAVQATEFEPHATVVLSTWSSRDDVFVEVTDNGPGIPEAWRPRVFEIFQSTKPQGSGLGLYSSRELARAAGGDLPLLSKPGDTRFVLTLPRTARP